MNEAEARWLLQSQASLESALLSLVRAPRIAPATPLTAVGQRRRVAEECVGVIEADITAEVPIATRPAESHIHQAALFVGGVGCCPAVLRPVCNAGGCCDGTFWPEADGRQRLRSAGDVTVRG